MKLKIIGVLVLFILMFCVALRYLYSAFQGQTTMIDILQTVYSEEQEILIKSIAVQEETILQYEEFYMKVPDRIYSSPMATEDFRGYSSPFGIRLDPLRSNTGGSRESTHTGEDMVGVPDALVIAIGTGRVINKYYSRGWHKVSGRNIWYEGHSTFDGLVEIQHPNGDISLQGHLDEIYVHEGQLVQAGDPVGRVSKETNGMSTGPHLHFSIRNSEGKYLPPFKHVNMPKEIE